MNLVPARKQRPRVVDLAARTALVLVPFDGAVEADLPILGTTEAGLEVRKAPLVSFRVALFRGAEKRNPVLVRRFLPMQVVDHGVGVDVGHFR